METKSPSPPRQAQKAARTLYIVAGDHGAQGADMARAKRFIRPQTALIEGIARARKCTGLFQEDVSEKGASLFNNMADSLSSAAYSERRRMLAGLRRTEEGLGYYGVALQLESLLRLRKEGIHLSYLPTEIEFDHADFVARRVGGPELALEMGRFMEGCMRRGLDAPAAKARLEGVLYSHEPSKSILIAERDRRITRNVLAFGLERNILQIGRLHALEDLSSGRDGLEVYRVDFIEGARGAVRMVGSLPRGLEDVASALVGKYLVQNAMAFR